MSPFKPEAVNNLEMPPELKQLAQDTTTLMAEQRPPFLEINKRLQKMKGYSYLFLIISSHFCALTSTCFVVSQEITQLIMELRTLLQL